jgi:hypothetical protein
MVFRSYKNGFVWHDLSEDDLVVPATDGEYVLKGSELVDQSPSGEHIYYIFSEFAFFISELGLENSVLNASTQFVTVLVAR